MVPFAVRNCSAVKYINTGRVLLINTWEENIRNEKRREKITLDTERLLKIKGMSN
jgi:hypothetical protein